MKSGRNANQKVYRARHPERVKKSLAGWHAKHPTYERELFDEYVGLCAYCQESATTLDHVVPISKGGAHSKANLVPACKSCNSSKHDKTLIVWLTTRRAA